MGYPRLVAMLIPRGGTIIVGLLATALVACSSGSDEKGLAEGEACYMKDTSLTCHDAAIVCYAAGTQSPCVGRGLCVGDGSGMVCARRCTQDADCSTTSATAVCIQGCPTQYINGHCVEPEQRDELLSTTCTTWESDTAGSSGVVS
jgi:hypothetical protein